MEEFSQFYEETYYSFQRFLVLKAPILDHVDDILQEAYFKVYQQMKRKPILDKKAYLFRVGWNLLKKEYKLKTEFSFDEDYFVFFHPIEEDLFSKITMEELWDYLKKQDILIQKCVYLYYLGMSMKEIANVLNLNLSNVKNYIYRTFQKIREEFR